MQESFYRKGSFEDPPLFCALYNHVLDLLRQVSIQGENSRRLLKTYSLDTWRQGAAMWTVWLKAYSEIGHDKILRIYAWAINWIQRTVYQYLYLPPKKNLTNTLNVSHRWEAFQLWTLLKSVYPQRHASAGPENSGGWKAVSIVRKHS